MGIMDGFCAQREDHAPDNDLGRGDGDYPKLRPDNIGFGGLLYWHCGRNDN